MGCSPIDHSLAFCLIVQVLDIPISWKKAFVSKEVPWIGWRLSFSAGLVFLEETKREPVACFHFVAPFLGNTRSAHKKDLERFFQDLPCGSLNGFLFLPSFCNIFTVICTHCKHPTTA